MTSTPANDPTQALLGDLDALRKSLEERRGRSPYPWDPEPIDRYNRLLERARIVLQGGSVALPEPLAAPASGERLWRTPTDDALQALEQLRAAISSGIQADLSHN